MNAEEIYNRLVKRVILDYLAEDDNWHTKMDILKSIDYPPPEANLTKAWNAIVDLVEKKYVERKIQGGGLASFMKGPLTGDEPENLFRLGTNGIKYYADKRNSILPNDLITDSDIDYHSRKALDISVEAPKVIKELESDIEKLETELIMAAPHIFLSYTTRDEKNKGFAQNIEQSLREEGFVVFLDVEYLNHDDAWKTKIIENLNKSNIIVAIFSPESKGSEWMNQELGFALARDYRIVKLCRGGSPTGFISSLQGEPMVDRGIEENVRRIIELIGQNSSRRLLINYYLLKLLKSQRFEDSAILFQKLMSLGPLSPEQIESLVKISIVNAQVNGSYDAVPELLSFANRNRSILNPMEYQTLIYQLKQTIVNSYRRLEQLGDIMDLATQYRTLRDKMKMIEETGMQAEGALEQKATLGDLESRLDRKLLGYQQ